MTINEYPSGQMPIVLLIYVSPTGLQIALKISRQKDRARRSKMVLLEKLVPISGSDSPTPYGVAFLLNNLI